MLSAIASAMLRLFIAAAAIVFMLSVLFAALVLGLVVAVFALLRGRRPVGIVWRGAPWASGAWRVRPRAEPREHGDVVDIEAREVVPAERREG